MAGSFRQTQAAGDYAVEVTATAKDQLLGNAQARFTVFEQDLELDNASADASAMESLAAMTGGQSLAPEQLPALIQRLAHQTKNLEIQQETKKTFWDKWPFFLVLDRPLGRGVVFAETLGIGLNLAWTRQDVTMSIEQPHDQQQLVEQTKRQIQALVQEIEQLSRRDVSPGEFYMKSSAGLLPRWPRWGGPSGPSTKKTSWPCNIRSTSSLPTSATTPRPRPGTPGSCTNASPRRKACWCRRTRAPAARTEAANPTDYLLVLAPLRTDMEVIGVVEIFQRPDAAPNVQQGYLRFLLQMCELAGDFFKSRQIRHFADRQVLWSQLEEFTRMVHA